MSTGFPLPGFMLVPTQTTSSFNITNPAGAVPSVFSDPYGVTPVTLPISVAVPTKVYVAGEGPWLVNGQAIVLEDNQVASIDGDAKFSKKPIPYFNPKDFGAKGDGVTDDTAACNAALLAAVTNGGWFVFPKGNFKTTAPILPPGSFGAVNGLHILGQGIGQSIVQFNPTASFGQAMGNANNDNGWIVEGFEIQGPGANTVLGATLGAGGQLSANFGSGVIGFLVNFLRTSVFREMKISGCTFGLEELGGGNNEYHIWTPSNRNVGIAILNGGAGSLITGLHQVTGASAPPVGETMITNIFLGNQSGSSGSPGPTGVRILVDTIDELQDLNQNGGGSSLHIAAGTDITVEAKQVYAPGKKQAAGNPFYGIRIGPLATRVTVRGTRIMPFNVDTTRVPTNTILIESGAVDTMLEDITTNPNAANGGGDISDSGTNTMYRNVALNGGPRYSAIPTKAGVPSDADYQVAPPVGTQVLDTTDGKIYYRTASATWKAATLA